MPTFDIKLHPLLSEKASRDVPDSPEHTAVFEANVLGAEFIHDLHGVMFDEPERNELAKLILVYQVNFQYENDLNMDVYNRVREGDTEYDYRDSFGVSIQAMTLRRKLSQMISEDQGRPHSQIKTTVVRW